jgi:hypothetical protein
MKKKEFTRLTKNLVKNLKISKIVDYNNNSIQIKDDKLIITLKENNLLVEYYFNVEKDGKLDITLERLKNIFNLKEKPLFRCAAKNI